MRTSTFGLRMVPRFKKSGTHLAGLLSVNVGQPREIGIPVSKKRFRISRVGVIPEGELA